MALVGYARVSSVGQTLAVQLGKLDQCDKIFQEKVSGVDCETAAAASLPGVCAPRRYLGHHQTRPAGSIYTPSLSNRGRIGAQGSGLAGAGPKY